MPKHIEVTEAPEGRARKKYQLRRSDAIRKARTVLAKVTEMAREALDIYNAVQRKDPISLMLGSLSAIGVVAELFEAEEEQAIDRLRDMGAKLVFPMMGKFIYLTFRQMDLPSKELWRETEEGKDDAKDARKIEEFDIGVPVYFAVTGNDEDHDNVRGPWVMDETLFVEAFSKLVRGRLGSILAVSVLQKGWDYTPFLTSLDLSSEAYVSPIDEDEFLRRIRRFYDMGMNRSILFFGPPGVGKTTLAARIAEKMDGKLLVLTPRGLDNLRFAALLDIIQIVDPAVVLFDDMDRLWRPEEMLNEMEQLNRHVRERKRLIIATVNDISDIPEALRRPGRFDEVIEFSSPNARQRRAILKAYAKRFSVKLKGADMTELVRLTAGMTGAYLREVMLRTSIIGFGPMPEQLRQMRRVARMPDLKAKIRKLTAAAAEEKKGRQSRRTR